MDTSRRHRALPHPYCLRCYGRLPRFDGATQECQRCGHLNVKADQGRVWSQEPLLRRVETALKVATAVLVAWIASILLTTSGGIGMGQGWSAGLPILLGALLWETASKLTREVGYLRAGVVWAILLSVPACLFLVGAVASTGPVLERLVLGGIGLALAAIAVTAWRASTWFEDWKRRRVLRRSEAPAAPVPRAG